MSVRKLIKEYNKEVSKLDNSCRPPLLNEERLTDLLLSDSDLWSLERFRCDEPWAKDPHLRRAISSLCTLDQAEEELRILSEECQRFVNQQCSELDSLERARQIVSPGSAIHNRLSKYTTDVVNSLSGMQKLQKLAGCLIGSQPSETCFKDLEGKLLHRQCNNDSMHYEGKNTRSELLSYGWTAFRPSKQKVDSF